MGARVALRHAVVADAPAIVALCKQSGYDVDEPAIVARIQQTGAERVFAVAMDVRSIVGLIVISVRDAFVSGYQAEVEVLVVDEKFRGRAVGSTLLTYAEQWATEKACDTLQLFSNVVRNKGYGFSLNNEHAVAKKEGLFRGSL